LPRGCAGVDSGRDGLGICRGPRRDARLPGHVGRLAAGRRGDGAHPGDPSRSGPTLVPEGVSASTFTDTQKALLADLVNQWITTLSPEDAAAKLATAEQNLDQTTFAWSGSTEIHQNHTRPAATSRTAGCTVRSRGRSTRMSRQAMSTMSASGYAAAVTFSIGEFVPCCRAGPSTKYRLKVTAAVITINPSTTTRARAATGIGPATAGSPAGARGTGRRASSAWRTRTATLRLVAATVVASPFPLGRRRGGRHDPVFQTEQPDRPSCARPGAGKAGT
jgi:hypothetical protein